MRKAVFVVLGLLEFAVAAVLVVLGNDVPRGAEVNDTFGKAERVTRNTGAQVRLVRRHIHELRRPELQDVTAKLQTETRTVTGTLRRQRIDFEAVTATRDALGNVATGLDGLAATLDPDTLGKLGEGLGTTASFLDEKVAPGAAEAAKGLEESTKTLRSDAERLGRLLREAPPDLKAAREIHDGLASFSKGLEQMSASLQVQRLDTIREGFQGLENSLTTGAGQVERLARYSYPVVTMNGLKPHVEQRPFWPEGGTIAEGMRKAAEGVKEASKEAERVAADLPKLRASLDASRKVADKTREALALALKQQDQVEPLLRNVPEHTAKLAEDLPKLGAALAQVLRDTERLKEVAGSLRQAQKGLDNAVAKWPELNRTLAQSAALLRALQQLLDQVLKNRQEYEAALQQTVVLADAFTEMLPWFTDNLDRQLAQQEAALGDLGQSLDEMGDALPVYAATTSRTLEAARLLLWLVAAIVFLHGAYLVLSVRLGPRFSV